MSGQAFGFELLSGDCGFSDFDLAGDCRVVGSVGGELGLISAQDDAAVIQIDPRHLEAVSLCPSDTMPPQVAGNETLDPNPKSK